MGNKNDLREILENLSQEEIVSLGKLLSQVSNKSNNRRRGKGTRKRKKKLKTPPSQTGFMDGVELSPDEIREIEEASKSDKKMGLDKSKTGSIIPKGPSFEKVSIKCMSCGKGFEVAPALLPPEMGRFKCNTCSCSAG
tara:strand:- start:7 stop:420 length:414 start_codon:yes stop_codon:yes gene_type:complete